MDQRRASLSAVVATLVTSVLDSSSSSSSSDSEEEHILHQLLGVANAANATRVPRLDECIEKALYKYSDEEARSHISWLLNSYSCDCYYALDICNTTQYRELKRNFPFAVVQFFQEFRIRRNVVLPLIERYAKSSFYVVRADRGGIPQKSPEEHILCFLWYATNKVCIKDVSIRFGLSESTVHGITERLLDYLCSLLPKEICFPENLDLLSDDFEQVANFPGVVGCIGGTRIKTRSPSYSQRTPSTHRQGSASVTLQAVCDSSCRFMDIFIGPPGDLQLDSVFLASPLAEELPYWCLDKYHLLGGVGYPLREYLLTPYDDNATGRSERSEMEFNRRHEKTRTKIDDTFRLLRQRFKQLHFLEFVTANKMRRFIMACCVLHNICVQAGDVKLDFECLDTDSGISSACSEMETEAEEEDERMLGSSKRDELAQSFVA